MTNTFVFVYFIIGWLLIIYWWKTKYSKEIEEANKDKSGVEAATVRLYLLVLLFFWPIKLINDAIISKLFHK